MINKTLPLILVIFIIQGCYSSDTPDDNDSREDAVDDRPDGTDGTDGTDTLPDDAAPDPDGGPDVDPDVDPDVPPARYRLHEWGVTVIGEDGASTHGPSPEFSGAIPAKPVIYLYADEEIGPVDIGIRFASGTATEVWPVIDLDQHIMWEDLEIFPGPCEITPFPSAWDDPDPEPGTCEACGLSTCVVSGAACVNHMFEGDIGTIANLLFYTGRLPDYEPPINASVSRAGDSLTVGVENLSSRLVEDIWLIYRQTEDACIDPSACPVVAADIAWMYIEQLEGTAGMGTSMGIQHFETEVDEYGWPIEDLSLPQEWLDLGKDLTAMLIERGLTGLEAGAFMTNWDTIFFGLMGTDSYYIDPFYSNGAFVIYFMSDRDYNAQLALSANPPPEETVRVGMIYEKIPVTGE
ncbi:MAG: hypothetical protein ABIJ56_04160 [Pseudomonadota bacterium]